MSPGRMRAAIMGAVVVLLVIASVVVGLLLRDQESEPAGDESPQPAATATAAPARQRTLLVQLADDEDQAVGNFLFGTPDHDTEGARLAIPSALLLPALEPVPLVDTPTARDTLQARRGIEAALGLRVDGSVVLDRLALAGLVDGVGGVLVLVEEPVRVRDEQGRVVRTIPAGPQMLDGVTAADYALAQQPGEPESARTSRQEDVLERVLLTLPAGSDELAQLVLSLGSSARSTATNEQLIAVLGDLHAAALEQRLTPGSLPVVTVRARRAATLARPEGPATVTRLFPDAALGSGSIGASVVHVWAAGGSTAQVAQAAMQLGHAGFTAVVGGQSADSTTQVLVPDDDPETIALGTQAARALRLDTAVVVRPPGRRLADAVIVLVGRDLPAL